MIFPGKEKKVYVPKGLVEKICEFCGTKFLSKLDRAKFCSHKCHAHAKYQSKPKHEATCKVCGETFMTSSHSQRHCSQSCQLMTEMAREKENKANQNQARRARERNAFIARVIRKEIFVRDHWICGICGQPVDQTLNFPHPGSKSLDHIVPLVGGGKHEPSNVQLAHFMCNSLKSGH
jgi:5-methylcytosine-specific restriction endonuclease McrA